MTQFTLALRCLLLASLLTTTVAIGQDIPREVPPTAKPAGTTETLAQAVEAVVRTGSTEEQVPADPSRLDALKQAYVHALRARIATTVPDALEAKFGLSLSDADDALRAQLEIPTGEGVVVVGVKPGSLAEHAGLKVNDILLNLGGQPTKGVEEAHKILLGLGKEALEVKLIREGKARRMSLVGPEHGFPPEAAEFWIGTPVSPVDATLRAHLPTLSDDSGLVVNDVVKGSPADQAAVKPNDILVAMDGKPLTSTDALIAQIQASKGKPVPVQLLRAGQPLTLTITPAKRAHPTVINVRPNPGQQFSYQLVQPGMAIEVTPGSAQGQADNKMARIWSLGQQSAPPTNLSLVPFPNYTSWNYQLAPKTEPPAERIEGQLKEVMAKLEEISRSLEVLKKTAGK
jgi:membrane-associated protease RseP (regulator of RpoE activity)